MSDTLLTLRDVHINFPARKNWLGKTTEHVHAINGIDLQIRRGETLGIVGESGCGKSTLAQLLMGMLQPSHGQYIRSGSQRIMQMVFQDPYSSLNPRQSVAEIIGEPLKVYHVCKSKQELDERVREIMDTVGLPERYQHSYPHELDGGRRQRIGIGRALALNPKFIVCDEPVSALDVSIQAQILNLMMDLQEKYRLTYIFVTHDLSVVKHISDDIMVMYLGVMVEKTSSEELFSCQLHPYTKALLSAIPIAKPNLDRKRIALKGELTSPIEPPKMCRFAPRCPYATERCFQEEPALEEVLPQHFVSCHRVKEINQL